MEYSEDEYLMISGLQHFMFCQRQWALIHLEQLWADNYHTAVGTLMHERAHDPYLKEKRRDVIISRALRVSSKTLGISGECDVVEFHRCEDGIHLHGHRGCWSICPVEYKKGKPKQNEEDILQLTAQAMCLEEMFSAQIPEGALFYGETRRRERVEFTDARREQVGRMFEQMRQYARRGYTPKVKKTKACRSCSLADLCLPQLDKAGSVKQYLESALKDEA